MVLFELLLLAVVVAVVVGNFRLGNQTVVILVLTALLLAEMDKVEVVVTELVAAEVVEVKMVVPAVDCLAATTAAILEKMAIVWRPEAVQYRAAQQVVAELLTQLALQEA
jgi:hypothetical protein